MTCRRLERLPAHRLPGGLELREARGACARALGLAWLRSPPPFRIGLAFAGCRCVHTFGMRFPIDVVFVGRDGRVVRVARDVAPRRLVACRRAVAVVEVRAGAGPAFGASLDLVAHGDGRSRLTLPHTKGIAVSQHHRRT